MSNFNWFSLDYVYYPVSGIMWLWYKLFGFLLGSTSFFAWALSVMFLVFTLRALLYKPFVKQIRTTRQMQELQPQIKALQKKYGKDRQKMAQEMQKLQREHNFNPLLGCLPMLAQVPVFIGLFHVLRSFNRTVGGFGLTKLTVEDNANTANYFFSAEDVRNFLSANLFGAPLGGTMIQTSGLEAFEVFSRGAVIAVGVPIMIAAGIATYFNSRASVERQSPEAAANPQTAMMNKLALYVFPLGVVVGGPFLPLAIILYWFSNNIWTFGQQHYVFGKIEHEEAEALERKKAATKANAPRPGQKPITVPAKMDPLAEFRKAVSQYDSGQKKQGLDTAERVITYLDKNRLRTAGGDQRPGGLAAEVADWLCERPELADTGRVEVNQRRLYASERATPMIKEVLDQDPGREDLAGFVEMRAVEIDAAYRLGEWEKVSQRVTDDEALLALWDRNYADLDQDLRFRIHLQAAAALHRMGRNDAAAAQARRALEVWDAVGGWPDEDAPGGIVLPGGYRPGGALVHARLLMIAAAGRGKGRMRDRAASRQRAEEAGRGVSKLRELAAEAARELGEDSEAAKTLRRLYEAALQQVANLYLGDSTEEVSAQVRDAGIRASAEASTNLFAEDDVPALEAAPEPVAAIEAAAATEPSSAGKGTAGKGAAGKGAANARGPQGQRGGKRAGGRRGGPAKGTKKRG